VYSHAVSLERIQRSILHAIGVTIASLLAVWLRHVPFAASGQPRFPISTYAAPIAVTLLVFGIVLWRTYAPRRLPSRPPWIERIRAVSFATAIVLTASFFLRGEDYSRATVLMFYPLAVGAIALADRIHAWILVAMLSNKAASRRALVIGDQETGARIVRTLQRHPAYYHLAGTLSDVGIETEGLPVLGRNIDLDRVLTEHEIDEVLIALPSVEPHEVVGMVGVCMARGVDWKVVPYAFDMIWDRTHIDVVDGLPLIGMKGPRLVGQSWALKRAFDLVLGGLSLMIAAPIMAIVAVAIRLSSSGPVIYAQERVGLNGKPFTLLKFRSMRADSDTAVHKDFTSDWIRGRTGGDGQGHKIDRDPRITWVGSLIRKTSLDELPQLWNVIRGDMSLVGPRPPIQYEVDRYTEWHKRRLSVPPGVTGLWQVSGRNGLSFDEMVDLDVKYIEQWSLGQDVSILLKTLPALVLDRGR
jgi:exopolysaccharide biosynthesis polyprenyl glycosylphosphotransferase